MHIRFATWVVLLLTAVALTPRSAHALAVTVKYSISSGVASGPELSGDVQSGGTISVTHPNAVNFYSAASTTLWYLNTLHFQTTGGRHFRMTGPPHLSMPGYANISTHYDHFRLQTTLSTPPLSSNGKSVVLTDMTVRAGGVAASSARSFGTVNLWLPGGMSHRLTIGSEINRVPEPDTFSQVALGVIGLAALAAGSPRRRRRG